MTELMRDYGTLQTGYQSLLARLLISARDHGFVPETLVYQAGTNESGIVRGLIVWALKEGAEVLEVSEAVLAKLASKDNPQTVLGVFKQAFAPPPQASWSPRVWRRITGPAAML